MRAACRVPLPAVDKAVPDLPGAVPTTPGLGDVRLTDPRASLAPSAPLKPAAGPPAAARPGGALGLADSAPATARVDGSKATFAGVRESADLELGPYPNGLKEVIVLRSPEAPTTWEFSLALEGLTARADDRQVVLEDEAGEPRAVIPPGWMEDSRTEDGMPATSTGVTYSLAEGEGGAQILRVELDREWLSDPARVFPVRVDPPSTSSASRYGPTPTTLTSPPSSPTPTLPISPGCTRVSTRQMWCGAI